MKFEDDAQRTHGAVSDGSVERNIRKILSEKDCTSALRDSVLEMQNDMRQYHAEEKEEKREDRRFELIKSLVDAAIGAVITLIIEHFGAIVSFFAELFH